MRQFRISIQRIMRHFTFYIDLKKVACQQNKAFYVILYIKTSRLLTNRDAHC